MHNRRGLLKFLFATVALAPGLPAAARPPQAQGAFHLVNGWILTDRDIELIRAHDH